MADKVQDLLNQLNAMLPMPDDVDPSDLDLFGEFSQVMGHYHDIVEQLSQYRDPRCIEPLLASFGYVDGNEVYLTTKSLLQSFGVEELDPYLLAALRHENKGTRYWAVMMVMNSRNKEAVPALIALLDDEAEYVRENAASALSAIGGASMRPYIERLSNDPSDDVRFVVRELLAECMEEEVDAPQSFLAALMSESPETRSLSAMRMKRARNRSAIPGLIALLDSERAFARAHAADVLSVIGGTAMRPHLERLCDDPAAGVRAVVRKILGTWDSQAAEASEEVDSLLEQLNAMLPMPDDEQATAELLVRYVNIIAKLSEHPETRCIEPLLDSFGYTVGAGAYIRTMNLLKSFDPDDLFPYLLAALRSGNRGTRLWAAKLLRGVGKTEAVLNLIELLDDEAEYVRGAAVNALYDLGGPAMQLLIERMRDDPSSTVRYYVDMILNEWAEDSPDAPWTRSLTSS